MRRKTEYTPRNVSVDVEPERAERERWADLVFIQENLDIVRELALEHFAQRGRGAIVVDTTYRPYADAGHPLYYLSQLTLNALDEPEIKRLVAWYYPSQEAILVLLKPHGGQSCYRVILPPEFQTS